MTGALLAETRTTRPTSERTPDHWRTRLRRLLVECQGHPCRRFTVSHRLLRRDGIYLGTSWYCGPDCFADALRERVASAAEGRRAMPLRPGRIPFRLILLARGVLSETQLQQSLRRQAEGAGTLETILIEDGLASEEQIASAKAEEAGVPFYAAELPQLPATAQLPRGLMERCAVAPVHVSRERLLAGFVEHVDSIALQAIAEVTGNRVEPCLIPRMRLREHLAQAPSGQATRGTAVSAAEAARITLARALSEGAEQVHVGSGDGWAWIRLSGAESSDLFFELLAGDSEGIPRLRNKRSTAL